MANDLIQLDGVVENQIDPNGSAGSILAINHQNILKSVTENVGKYTGLQFKAKKETDAGVVNSGEFIWNSNPMNKTSGFMVTVSSRTLDGQSILRVLQRLKTGDLIKFKDKRGRAVFLEFKKYGESTDVNSNIVYNIAVSGFTENVNYTYQVGEILDCMIEIFPSSVESGLIGVQNTIQQMRFDFFWANREDGNETEGDRVVQSARIDGHFGKLGVNIQNYDLFNSFEGATFYILIDRYRKQEDKGDQNNVSYLYRNHRKSGYRHENFDQTNGSYNVNRINKIEIDSNKMLLNFGQDFYFKEIGATFGEENKFPQPVGTRSKNVHSTSVVKMGFVDLAFRIRIEIPSESYVWESQHIGKIRMLGVYDITDPLDIKKFITYSYK